MTAPAEYKTIKVSPDIHRRIHSIAAKLETTADGAIAFLLGAGTVRVPVTTTERDRWIAAAQSAGLSVEEFVKLRVEAALALGSDPYMVHQHVQHIARTVDAIASVAGITVPPSTPRAPATPRPPAAPPTPYTTRTPQGDQP